MSLYLSHEVCAVHIRCATVFDGRSSSTRLDRLLDPFHAEHNNNNNYYYYTVISIISIMKRKPKSPW